jgi:hypothetical protein
MYQVEERKVMASLFYRASCYSRRYSCNRAVVDDVYHADVPHGIVLIGAYCAASVDKAWRIGERS